MIRFVFFDLDDTLLDFGMAERVGVSKAFRDIGLVPTDELLQLYSRINAEEWARYERNEISRDTVLVERFDILFRTLGISLPGACCEERYRKYLSLGHYFIPGAEEILRYLSPRYALYLASNGVAATQYSRLESAGIRPYFKNIFISETMGAHKPEPAYFNYCFAQIASFDPAKALMIGDSLTSDILGGSSAGMQTCWFNPSGKKRCGSVAPDYEIHALEELRTIL